MQDVFNFQMKQFFVFNYCCLVDFSRTDHFDFFVSQFLRFESVCDY